MRFFILRISIMDIIGRHQRNARLLAHAKQALIDCFLGRNPVVLKLQKEIPLSENLLKFQSFKLCVLIKPLLDILGHNSGQTGAERNNSLVILPKHLHVYPRFIIKAFGKASGNNLHQIVIARIILRQKH